MQELLSYLVRLLVEDEDSVRVDQTKGDQTVVLEIRVKEEDLGRLIGRKGKTARALRTVAQAAAQKKGCRAVVEIVS
ncbi:MAG: KH domain-containing protein [Candidatus Schekmanbacteria bacterium]|nr:KH domain-containing protein [Candidatus Schekmanbacteria bacterium]